MRARFRAIIAHLAEDGAHVERTGRLLLRGSMGGTLMGLANLVPGISGGTMLVAAGVYPRFIAAIAELSALRFSRPALLLLGAVVGSAALAILLLAGPVKTLVVEQRWIMYSLFIGLTLGGVPALWRLLERRAQGLWLPVLAGFLAMAAVAMLQADPTAGTERDGFLYLLLAGVAGSAAMILPGISGGYLLLILGVYVPILAGIDAFKQALLAADLGGLWQIGLTLVLPVGLGVVLGIVAVSHALRWLLARYQRPTLGMLLGLLLGALVGLWPFQQPHPPEPGSQIKGQTVVQAEDGGLRLQPSGRPLSAADYPTRSYAPSALQALSALGLLLLGLLATSAVDWLGRRGEAGTGPG